MSKKDNMAINRDMFERLISEFEQFNANVIAKEAENPNLYNKNILDLVKQFFS
jgi:hypothetical protein